MLIQRSIILLLVMMIVLAECGEGEPEKIKSKEFVDEEPKIKNHLGSGWH